MKLWILLLVSLLLISSLSMVKSEETKEENVNDDAAYRSEFEEYDLNKDGSIEKDEIIKVVGSDADEKEVSEFFEQVDTNTDNKITFEEYIEAVKKWEEENEKYESELPAGEEQELNDEDLVDIPEADVEEIAQV